MIPSILLTLAVGLSALSVATRAWRGDRAEILVGATVLAATLVLAPIYALGLFGALTRENLAATVASGSALVFALSCRGVGAWAQLGETARAFGRIASMPGEGLAMAWRERSALLVCLLACALLFAYHLPAAYLAPSWREWDALWYHEPIVGFSIQNHGFAPVDLPLGGAQKANGYPRAGEMLSLWFAIFAGRRLIELPNVLLMPALVAAAYAMCRRATGDRLSAAGWAAVAGTMPSYAELLQTVYVDPAVVAFVSASALFVLRSPLRVRDALLAAAAIAIAANIKLTGVFAGVPLALVAAGRMLAGAHRRERVRALVTVLGGAAWIVAFSAATYLRNYVLFHNPVWPDLHVRLPSLGIDWPGNYPFEVAAKAGSGHLDNNLPLRLFLEELVAPPGTVKETNQKYIHLYGVGVIWVFFPAALLVPVKLARFARPVITRWAAPAHREAWFRTLWLAAVAFVTLVTSTNRSTPRYHLPTLLLLLPAVAWTLGRRRALQTAVAFATCIGSLVVIAWEMPGWRAFPGPRTMLALARAAAPLREITPEYGATVLLGPGLAREKELGAGTTVVSDDFVFPAVLWNNDYSNRVVYVRPTEDLATAGDRLGATWLYANDDRSAGRLRRNPKWEEIGPLYVEGWGRAFRRVR